MQEGIEQAIRKTLEAGEQEGLDQAARQALEARERAAACVGALVRDQWLQVAEIWEKFAQGREAFQKFRGEIASGSVPDHSRRYPRQQAK